MNLVLNQDPAETLDHRHAPSAPLELDELAVQNIFVARHLFGEEVYRHVRERLESEDERGPTVREVWQATDSLRRNRTIPGQLASSC